MRHIFITSALKYSSVFLYSSMFDSHNSYILLLFVIILHILSINWVLIKERFSQIRRRISRLPLTRKFWFDLNPSLQTLGKYWVKHRLVKIFRTWVFQKLKMKVWNWLYAHTNLKSFSASNILSYLFKGGHHDYSP